MHKDQDPPHSRASGETLVCPSWRQPLLDGRQTGNEAGRGRAAFWAMPAESTESTQQPRPAGNRCQNRASRNSPGLTVALNCGVGSSSLQAAVNALETLQNVPGRNSLYCGSKFKIMHRAGEGFGNVQFALQKCLVDDHLSDDLRQLASLPGLLSQRLVIALHPATPAEMRSISENDCECWARVGVKAPETMFPNSEYPAAHCAPKPTCGPNNLPLAREHR
jgi:hypothetical protein